MDTCVNLKLYCRASMNGPEEWTCLNEDEVDFDLCGPECPGYISRDDVLATIGDDLCHARREK